MPWCGKCGFQVTDEMQFCPNCGVPLKTQTHIQSKPIPSARTNNNPVLIRAMTFGEGIIIGLGVAMLVGSLLGYFFLNADYVRLQDNFLANGFGPQQIHYLLSSTVLLIGFCAEFAVIGFFFLVSGTLSHTYSSVRAVMNNGAIRARSGVGLLAGGTVFIASSVQFLVRNTYFSETFLVWSWITFGIVGGVQILLALFFIKTAYTKQQQ